MKQSPFKLRALLISVAIVLAVLSFLVVKINPAKTVGNNLCFNQTCFKVEIASATNDRQTGLMNRDSLDQDKGMLFVFDKEGNYPIWMKNTKFPLDVIWINKDGKVVDVQTLSPCTSGSCPSFSAKSNAKYILEINSGLASKDNIKIGDKADLR